MVAGWRTCLAGEVFGKVVIVRVFLGLAIGEEKVQQATRRKTDWRREGRGEENEKGGLLQIQCPTGGFEV